MSGMLSDEHLDHALGATDRLDLEGRLCDLEELPEQAPLAGLLLGDLAAGPLEALAGSLPAPPEDLAVAEARRLTSGVVAALRHGGAEAVGGFLGNDPAHDFIFDHDLSPSISLCLLGGVQAGIALAVLARALGRPEPPPAWLAAFLAERWAEGMARWLQLLASVPGTDVPEALVPAELRLDLECLAEEHAAFNRLREEWHKAAMEHFRRTGEACYFPFGKPDDEED